MTQAFTIAADPVLTDYITSCNFDPWTQTSLRGYVFLGSKRQGAYGEKYVSLLLASKGFDVKPPTNTGHDRIVDGIKTEIKFSVAIRDNKTKQAKPNSFIINHAAEEKDWQRLIFCGINPDGTYVLRFFTKEDFSKEIKSSERVFKRQQNGEQGTNDDYCCPVEKLLDKSWFQPISAWSTIK